MSHQKPPLADWRPLSYIKKHPKAATEQEDLLKSALSTYSFSGFKQYKHDLWFFNIKELARLKTISFISKSGSSCTLYDEYKHLKLWTFEDQLLEPIGPLEPVQKIALETPLINVEVALKRIGSVWDESPLSDLDATAVLQSIISIPILDRQSLENMRIVISAIAKLPKAKIQIGLSITSPKTITHFKVLTDENSLSEYLAPWWKAQKVLKKERKYWDRFVDKELFLSKRVDGKWVDALQFDLFFENMSPQEITDHLGFSGLVVCKQAEDIERQMDFAVSKWEEENSPEVVIPRKRRFGQ